MANVIKIYRRTTDVTPTGEAFPIGAIGYVEHANKKILYYRNTGGSYEAIGGRGAFADLTFSNIPSGSKATARTNLGVMSTTQVEDHIGEALDLFESQKLGNSANKAPLLDANGKLAESVLPSLALT